MRLSDFGGPFEQATASAGAASTTIDRISRIQETALANGAVVLDGTLPPQKPLVSRVWFGPLVLVGVLGVLTYFAKRAEDAERLAPDETQRSQEMLQRELRRIGKQTTRLRRQERQAA